MRVSPLLTGCGQEGLELPGSNTYHSLKAAKLSGGIGLSSWRSPSLQRTAFMLSTDMGPSSETGQVVSASQAPEQGSNYVAWVHPT